jgi:hypothetical protein
MSFSHARTFVLFPPPLWGSVREGGTPPKVSVRGTPFPSPSPQGGGEPTSRAATSEHALLRKGVAR